MSTMTLTEFLLARIAEDLALVGAEPDSREQGGMSIGWDEVGGISEVLMIGEARLRAECESKRLIVELHSATDHAEWYGNDDPPEDGLGCTTCGTHNEYAVAWPCATLRAVLSPYVDHPDYLFRWAP